MAAGLAACWLKATGARRERNAERTGIYVIQHENVQVQKQKKIINKLPTNSVHTVTIRRTKCTRRELLDNPGGAFLTGCRASNVHASNPIEYYKLTELITKGELLHHVGVKNMMDYFQSWDIVTYRPVYAAKYLNKGRKMRPLTQSVILMMVAVDGLERSVVRFVIADMVRWWESVDTQKNNVVVVVVWEKKGQVKGQESLDDYSSWHYIVCQRIII